jgi:TolA-binding protein
MNYRRLLLPGLMLIPLLAGLPAQAASKEMIELMRDISQIQEQMRLLQQSVDTKFAEIQVLARQAADGTNRNQTTMADLQRGIQSGTADLGKQVAQPIAAMNSRIDGLSNDMQAMQNSIADQNAKMAKIQQQLTDVLNAVKTMQAPAPPPPTTAEGTALPLAGGGAGSSPAGPPASATQLWANGKRDMDGGNADLALQEFSDYVKWYRDSDLAPNAQYNIGNIHYFQKKYDLAVEDFDQLLEAFPINPKTPDAHYMKGRSLVALGQRAEAVKEFKVCTAQFGSSLVAPKCKESLAALPPSAASSTRTNKKKDE